MAKFVGNTVTVLQERYDQQQAEDSQPNAPNGGERLKRGEERRAEIELEIDRAMEELREWYTPLIQASNYVFQVNTGLVGMTLRDCRLISRLALRTLEHPSRF